MKRLAFILSARWRARPALSSATYTVHTARLVDLVNSIFVEMGSSIGDGGTPSLFRPLLVALANICTRAPAHLRGHVFCFLFDADDRGGALRTEVGLLIAAPRCRAARSDCAATAALPHSRVSVPALTRGMLGRAARASRSSSRRSPHERSVAERRKPRVPANVPGIRESLRTTCSGSNLSKLSNGSCQARDVELKSERRVSG